MSDSSKVYPEDLSCKLLQLNCDFDACPFYCDNEPCPSIEKAPARLRAKIAQYKEYIKQIEAFLKEEG